MPLTWRGPVWFPINSLLIEALQKFHYLYGDSFTVEVPSGSGERATLWQAAAEISRRLTKIFLRSSDGTRPVYVWWARKHFSKIRTGAT